jgi:hypothetical protein
MQSQLEKDLIAGRALITDEKNWTQGTLSELRQRMVMRAGDWRVIDFDNLSPVVTCTIEQYSAYCSMGAIFKAVQGCMPNPGEIIADDGGRVMAVAKALAALAGGDPDEAPRYVVAFNDNSSHAEVLALWDRAIAREQARNGRRIGLRVRFDEIAARHAAVDEIKRIALDACPPLEPDEPAAPAQPAPGEPAERELEPAA